MPLPESRMIFISSFTRSCMSFAGVNILWLSQNIKKFNTQQHYTRLRFISRNNFTIKRIFVKSIWFPLSVFKTLARFWYSDVAPVVIWPGHVILSENDLCFSTQVCKTLVWTFAHRWQLRKIWSLDAWSHNGALMGVLRWRLETFQHSPDNWLRLSTYRLRLGFLYMPSDLGDLVSKDTISLLFTGIWKIGIAKLSYENLVHKNCYSPITFEILNSFKINKEIVFERTRSCGN